MIHSSVELAQIVERLVHKQLSNKRREGSTGFIPVFSLYQTIADSPVGSQVTTGFFSRILSDLRKTGVVVTQNGGKFLALSEDAWKVQEKYDAQRKQFNELIESIVARNLYPEFAIHNLLRGIPVGSDISFYVQGKLRGGEFPLVEDRYLVAAITVLREFEKTAKPMTEAVSK